MIKHEDFKTICKRDDYVDISMDIKNIVERNRWNVVAAPAGYGKTTVWRGQEHFIRFSEEGACTDTPVSIIAGQTKTAPDNLKYLILTGRVQIEKNKRIYLEGVIQEKKDENDR